MTNAEGEVRVAYQDHVAVLTVDRPDRLNAWTAVMGEEFRTAIATATHDTGVRAIVITGAGKGFCPGVDVRQLEGAAGREVFDRDCGDTVEMRIDFANFGLQFMP